MFKRFQNQLFVPGIKISEDGKERKELPLKFLVLGRFNQLADTSCIAEREKINVSKDNISRVLSEFSPSIVLTVPDYLRCKQELEIKLQFNALNDFRPEKITEAVPELKQLVALRNVLIKLRENIIEDRALKLIFDKISQNKDKLQKLKKELSLLFNNELQGMFP